MPAENIYRIKEGDTLSDLFGQNWQEVAAFNGIDDPTKLQVGQEVDLNLYEPQPAQQQVQQEEQPTSSQGEPSGEEGFLSGAADWASSYFKEVGADTRDVYENLSASSIGDDVFSSFGNSPMPTSLEELGSPEELAAMGDIGTLEDYKDVTVGDWAGGAPAEQPAPVGQGGDAEVVNSASDFSQAMEGFVPDASSVPSDFSGITIAWGTDLSQTSAEKLRGLLSDESISRLEAAGAFGALGPDARAARALLGDWKLSEDEIAALDKVRKDDIRAGLTKYTTAFPELSNNTKAVLTQSSVFAGEGFLGVGKETLKYTIKNAAGELYNPLKDAVDSKGEELTDEDVTGALTTINRYWTGRGWKQNARSFQRYLNYIERNDPDANPN